MMRALPILVLAATLFWVTACGDGDHADGGPPAADAEDAAGPSDEQDGGLIDRDDFESGAPQGEVVIGEDEDGDGP